MDFLKNLPIEFLLVLLAVSGGCARYLSSYTNGTPFKVSVFLASGAVAGFTGYIFAIFGATMALPDPMLFVMAGIGGFFGEQTMKFVLESVIKDKK